MDSEVLALKKRVEFLEEEVKKIEKLEQSLAYHEIVLAKKVSDIYAFEEKMKGFVDKKYLDKVKEDLKRFEGHDDLIFENAKQVHELLGELTKLKESHKTNTEASETKIKAPIGKEHLNHLEIVLNNRLSQIEYQNRLIMKYLKIVDEKFLDSKR